MRPLVHPAGNVDTVFVQVLQVAVEAAAVLLDDGITKRHNGDSLALWQYNNKQLVVGWQFAACDSPPFRPNDDPQPLIKTHRVQLLKEWLELI